MPPLPPPEGMHVLVVHFPVALLFIAPLFVVIGALTGLRSMLVSALILMSVGVVSAFVATQTGELAMDYMEDFDIEDEEMYDLAYEVLDAHEVKAEASRNWFLGCTVLYGALLLVTKFSKKLSGYFPRLGLNLAFLALWAYPVTLLADAAHEGGRLVHQFGLRSVLAETAETEEEDAEEDSDDAEEEVADEGEDLDPAAEDPETEDPAADQADEEAAE